MTHISLRVSTEELEQWRHHAGREPLSRWIRRTINQALVAAETQQATPTPAAAFDPDCVNNAYHWKGTCKYCGGTA